MGRFTKRVAVLSVFAALLSVTACVDGRSPTAPDLARSVQLAVAPVFSGVPAAAEAAALTRARVTAFDVSSGLSIATAESDIDPNATQWTLELTVEVTSGVPLRILIQVELAGAEGSVEWSGRSASFGVQSGSTPTEVREISLFRGPPANLDVTSVTIKDAPVSLLEGESGQLQVDLTGGGEGARVYFASLDPDIASVDASGQVQALAPGTARIEAKAGPASAEVSVKVEEVKVPDAGEIDASVSPMLDYAEGVVGSMGDPAGAAAVASSLGSLTTALASGDGAAAVRAFYEAVGAWSGYGAGTALRVLDGPQLSLIELSLIMAADALGISFG